MLKGACAKYRVAGRCCCWQLLLLLKEAPLLRSVMDAGVGGVALKNKEKKKSKRHAAVEGEHAEGAEQSVGNKGKAHRASTTAARGAPPQTQLSAAHVVFYSAQAQQCRSRQSTS